MKTKYLGLAVCCFIAALFIHGAAAQAADAGLSLQPNRSYEFTGTDPRVISYVTVSGNTRYDYVSKDAKGVVADYGTTSGRIPVRGGGSTLVSSSVPLSVSYDTEKLSLREREGNALQYIRVNKGETIRLENKHTDNLAFTVNYSAPYDCVIYDREDKAAFYNREIRFPSIRIPTSGSAVLTAAEGEMTLVFPAEWHGGVLVSQKKNTPALSFYDLAAGSHYALANNGERSYSLSVLTKGLFIYDYITRNKDGYAIDDGEGEGESFAVHEGQTKFFTPQTDAVFYYPYDWNRFLRLTQGNEITPAHRLVAPGASLIIENRDPVKYYTIYFESERPNQDFSYDYALEDVWGVDFKRNQKAANISIPPLNTMTLTNRERIETLAVRLPEIPAVSVEPGSQKALYEYVLKPGESVFVRNNHEETRRVLPLREVNLPARALDFVLKDDIGEISGFGRKNPDLSFDLNEGCEILLTNVDKINVVLVFPRVWAGEDGLTLRASKEPALYRQELRENQPYNFQNADRRYNQAFLVENESETRPVAFDYLTLGEKNAVLDYGVGRAGLFELRNLSNVTIMAQRGVQLSVCYPAEWHKKIFKASAAANPPLYRRTIRPGESVTLLNRLNFDVFIQNNSVSSAAAYFLKVPSPGESTRPLPGEQPESGPISLKQGDTLVVTAASGEDLEIWAPVTWSRLVIK